MTERTLVILKPDCIQRALTGHLISRFEDKGLKISGMKLMQISADLAAQHYGEHRGKDFFAGAVAFLSSGPVVVLVLTGDNAIRLTRNLVGATLAEEAAPGTIRGDYAKITRHNLVHASDSAASAATEIARYFTDGEIVDYQRDIDSWT